MQRWEVAHWRFHESPLDIPIQGSFYLQMARAHTWEAGQG